MVLLCVQVGWAPRRPEAEEKTVEELTLTVVVCADCQVPALSGVEIQVLRIDRVCHLHLQAALARLPLAMERTEDANAKQNRTRGDHLHPHIKFQGMGDNPHPTQAKQL